MPEGGYGPFARGLHRLALGRRFITELSFEIEQALYRFDASDVVRERHVFIAGLARAGTTILMRRFHATGMYRSLTYRDMPFVLMPNLWKRLSGASKKSMAPQERAHGDGVMVDFDSPEALEEVFWRIFAGDQYIRPDALLPMEADAESIDRFRRYVAAIIASGQGQKRYLSKNNNNILRLPALRRSFPDALIVIPFRDPVQQSLSLMAQHERFIAEHGRDEFVKSYMGWLAHHEFGSGHRPFIFGDGMPNGLSGNMRAEPDYWLRLWLETYGALLDEAPGGTAFVSYERLCAETGRVWRRLAEKAGLGEASLDNPDPLLLRTRESGRDFDRDLLDAANAVHARLLCEAAM